MPRDVFDADVEDAIAAARRAALHGETRPVSVHGSVRQVPYPFPSPVDWREHWIYFLMLDRFNNPDAPPRGPWDQRFDFRHGGTFAGVTAQLDYLEALGAGAIWLSPVVKNPRPERAWNYHGYAAQDFLSLDERFASDGRSETAEREFEELVQGAHARGIRVVLDIVLNHAGQVFDYVRDGSVTAMFTDPAVLDGPPGSEPDIRWVDGTGNARADWQNVIPAGDAESPDDAVYPRDLRRPDFFRRRGSKTTDRPSARGYVVGDFDTLRQVVLEYRAGGPGTEAVRRRYGTNPLLTVLVRAYSYLIARYDLDALRIDTAKYVSPVHLEWFGNAMREFGASIGKRNLFTFGEIYDDEETIAAFVGRNSTEAASFGIDSALDFPLFFRLPAVVKARGGAPVEDLRRLFAQRTAVERELLSSHGEAGRFFVTFLDNHDQHERFRHPLTPDAQVTLGLACLFCLPGIPALYYGTEAGLSGTVAPDGSPDLTANESSREALWGMPGAFDRTATTYRHVADIAGVRAEEPALQFGRLYFREVSGNASDFGHSYGPGGMIAFSRILADREVSVVANCSTTTRFRGSVLRDPDIGAPATGMAIRYSNVGTTGGAQIQRLTDARFHDRDRFTGTGDALALPVDVGPMEVQVWTPA